MSLESSSKELKEIVSTYNSDWWLGDLYFLIHAGRERAGDQLAKLSSPLRQLYYLAGLNITSDPSKASEFSYVPTTWAQILKLLNEIEGEYDKLFFPTKPEEVTEEWKRVRSVAMPSFLSYFNQGPLNFEEQVVNWINDLYKPLDPVIQAATGCNTDDFIQFYNNLDKLRKRNFQAHSTNKDLLRPNWEKYTKIKMGVADNVPDFIKKMGERDKHLFSFMSDKGIIDRFYPEELVTELLPVEKVKNILSMLSLQRVQGDFLYYTETRPGNPLFEKPILNIGEGMFQVFEVKQVAHAIDTLLERVCCSNKAETAKYTKVKGDLLEDRVADLFSQFFNSDFIIHRGYFVDGCEQDILILWKDYTFIIEMKGYNMREPFRDPDKAFVRIKDDFKASIGYGYEQTRRVERKFIDEVPLRITDHKGNLIAEIDTTQYKQDFSIIVTLESFGQIQCDLSTLITLETEEDLYPWAVRLDDLETFLLTMLARKKKPMDLVHFLLLREALHGKLICTDELEIGGGFLTGKLKKGWVERAPVIKTAHELSDIFDEQYRKTLGFKNERYLDEKQGGKTLFW
ncbi:MAG: hypothetical protein WDO14_24310 [Bacteroidota bacterium]